MPRQGSKPGKTVQEIVVSSESSSSEGKTLPKRTRKNVNLSSDSSEPQVLEPVAIEVVHNDEPSQPNKYPCATSNALKVFDDEPSETGSGSSEPKPKVTRKRKTQEGDEPPKKRVKKEVVKEVVKEVGTESPKAKFPAPKVQKVNQMEILKKEIAECKLKIDQFNAILFTFGDQSDVIAKMDSEIKELEHKMSNRQQIHVY